MPFKLPAHPAADGKIVHGRCDYAQYLDEWIHSICPSGCDSINPFDRGELTDEQHVLRFIDLGRLSLFRNAQTLCSAGKRNQELLASYRRQNAANLDHLMSNLREQHGAIADHVVTCPAV